MFRGINAVNLDEKGRITIPTRYRAQLQCATGRLILTIDTEEPCLLLYPIETWEIIEKKLEKLPSFNKAANRIKRLLMGHATESEMDGSGRLLLPQSLRDYAVLKKNCVLIGQGNKFEIWDEENWAGYRKQLLDNPADPDSLPSDLANLAL